MSTTTASSRVPAIMRGRNVLAPIKVDLIHAGARHVDTFCWDMGDKVDDVEVFAARCCADLALPVGFASKISAQMTEQLDSYAEIIGLLEYAAEVVAGWDDKMRELQIERQRVQKDNTEAQGETQISGQQINV